MTLTPAERHELEKIATAGQVPTYKISRAQILLKADTNQTEGGWSDPAISKALNVSLPAIERVRRRFAEERLDAILGDHSPRSTRWREPVLAATSQASEGGLMEAKDDVTMVVPVSSVLPEPGQSKPGVTLRRSSTQSAPKAVSPGRAVRLPARLSHLLERQWVWTILLPMLVLVVTGVTGWSTWRWLVSLPPASECKNLALPTVPDGERLYCANQTARRGDVVSLAWALDFVNQISPENPLHSQAMDLADEWSRTSLLVARRQIDQGNFRGAVTLLQKVPKSSRMYQEAQELIQIWQEQWDEGEQILQAARSELKQKEWTQAMVQMRELSNLGGQYWQARADKLLDEIIIARKVAQPL